jgi:N-acetylmuramoyl-L-alanine amidase
MLPIKRQLDPDDHYDGGNTHEYIVIHDTGNATDSDEGNANFFCTGSRGASAHYFVDNDSITQVVDDNDCSWHCGDGHGAYGITNTNSIGIEMCRVNYKVTSITEDNTIELVKFLMAKYNVPIEKVVRHYDASRKNCPSSLSADNWARWWAFKEKLKPCPSKIHIIVNGADIDKQMGAEAISIGGKVFVPVRDIAQALGATVAWDSKTKSVIIKKK